MVEHEAENHTVHILTEIGPLRATYGIGRVTRTPIVWGTKTRPGGPCVHSKIAGFFSRFVKEKKHFLDGKIM